jgi:hypothetical protein
VRQSITGRIKRQWVAVLWAATVMPLTFGVNFAAFTPEARLAMDETRAYALQHGGALSPLPRSPSRALAAVAPPDDTTAAAVAGDTAPVDASTGYLIDRAVERARHRREAPLTAWSMVIAVSVFAGGSLPLLLAVTAFSQRSRRR